MLEQDLSTLSKHPVWYLVLISNGKFLILLNGKFDLAREMFDKMPERDLFSWNVMLSGYVRNKILLMLVNCLIEA